MSHKSSQGLQILVMNGVSVTSASQILESFWNILESSITTKKAIFRVSSTWSWCVYTIMRDTQSSCGGPPTWKAQIHDGSHRVNLIYPLPFLFCRAVEFFNFDDLMKIYNVYNYRKLNLLRKRPVRTKLCLLPKILESKWLSLCYRKFLDSKWLPP